MELQTSLWKALPLHVRPGARPGSLNKDQPTKTMCHSPRSSAIFSGNRSTSGREPIRSSCHIASSNYREDFLFGKNFTTIPPVEEDGTTPDEALNKAMD